jgi:hypothetical protein
MNESYKYKKLIIPLLITSFLLLYVPLKRIYILLFVDLQFPTTSLSMFEILFYFGGVLVFWELGRYLKIRYARNACYSLSLAYLLICLGKVFHTVLGILFNIIGIIFILLGIVNFILSLRKKF